MQQQPPHCSHVTPGTFSAERKDSDDNGDEYQNRACVLEAGLELHFVKLRPEPVTGGNVRNLVQVLWHILLVFFLSYLKIWCAVVLRWCYHCVFCCCFPGKYVFSSCIVVAHFFIIVFPYYRGLFTL